MFAPCSVPRPRSRQFGIYSAVLAAAAFSWANAAGAAPPKKADRDVPTDTGKPAFFVDWGASNSPPGLTARPSRAKSDSLPVYPADSARRGEAGTTALTICITADGRLVDIKMARSSGFPRLDEATITWARTARFNPATINGDPVNICGYALEYAWKLGG